jgi:YkoY family integral membrane protein
MPFEVSPNDIATIGLLVFMEGILSIDNALVLAMIARKLPKEQQTKALTYGLAGAIIFRIIALFSASFLMRWTWVKFVGGGYLIWIAAAHWWSGGESDESDSKAAPTSFWKAVLLIELTDIAFAVDSILAAVALSNKLWVIVIGGVIGIICMRFAAKGFITFLERFPNFASTAYVLVFGIGLKLVVDGFHFEGVNFHSSESPAFWIFWGYILIAIIYGFLPKRLTSK